MPIRNKSYRIIITMRISYETVVTNCIVWYNYIGTHNILYVRVHRRTRKQNNIIAIRSKSHNMVFR